jgi:hypothetical protein
MPELPRPGLFGNDDAGTTLRYDSGLPRPPTEVTA